MPIKGQKEVKNFFIRPRLKEAEVSLVTNSLDLHVKTVHADEVAASFLCEMVKSRRINFSHN